MGKVSLPIRSSRADILKNHLIETASHSTGSLLIWDTGEYSVLPYRTSDRSNDTDSGSQASESEGDTRSETQKLVASLRQRKIKLRLHGTRLPRGYTIALRLSKENYKAQQPDRPSRTRKKKDPTIRKKSVEDQTTSDSQVSSETIVQDDPSHIASLERTESPPIKKTTDREKAIAAASDDESDAIRLSNAYPGATNDVGSIHQRRWYLSLDRENSGFIATWDRKTKCRSWVKKTLANGVHEGFDRFVVMGREGERSVVTGRLAKDLLSDEGVNGYVPRGLWRPVTE